MKCPRCEGSLFWDAGELKCLACSRVFKEVESKDAWLKWGRRPIDPVVVHNTIRTYRPILFGYEEELES